MTHPYLRQKSNSLRSECTECEVKDGLDGLTDGLNGLLVSGLLVVGLLWAIRRI